MGNSGPESKSFNQLVEIKSWSGLLLSGPELPNSALSSKSQHSISYTLSRSHSVIVEYTDESTTDMFQGAELEGHLEYVVKHYPLVAGRHKLCVAICKTGKHFRKVLYFDNLLVYLSAYLCNAFSSSMWVVPQERAANWQTVDGLMDGLTTNGVPVMHSAGDFVSDPDPGVWRVISVCGNVYTLRETRSAQQSGSLIENESNLLQDGSLIDLCGVTLLWRTTSGLHSTPSLKQLEVLRQELNAARPQCPVGLSTHSAHCRHTVDKKQPWVYMHCGHVHGYHSWGSRWARPGAAGTAPAVSRLCPLWPVVKIKCQSGACPHSVTVFPAFLSWSHPLTQSPPLPFFMAP
uniref:Pellino E3 ubiquitin protein ligase family member 3 n=1 Tax=Paramormyrops kingsleyae TaxID=1676925 RepID=A0A3B3T7T2_9TELE